jgi:ribose 5-phosphate isomerase B
LTVVRLAFATDERNATTECLVAWLSQSGHEVIDLARGEEWPEVGRAVAQAVARGEADRGIVCCHTGTGVSIAANKVPGVRAALCGDAETAAGARRWNDANVLALALSRNDGASATRVAQAFLEADAEPEEAAAVARLESS